MANFLWDRASCNSFVCKFSLSCKSVISCKAEKSKSTNNHCVFINCTRELIGVNKQLYFTAMIELRGHTTLTLPMFSFSCIEAFNCLSISFSLVSTSLSPSERRLFRHVTSYVSSVGVDVHMILVGVKNIAINFHTNQEVKDTWFSFKITNENHSLSSGKKQYTYSHLSTK